MLPGLYNKLIALALVVSVVFGVVWYVRHLQVEVATLSDAKSKLEGKLADQNKAIDDLKSDADKRLKEGEAKLVAAQVEADRAKGRATIIYKTAPSHPGDVCHSALDLVNSGVGK